MQPRGLVRESLASSPPIAGTGPGDSTKPRQCNAAGPGRPCQLIMASGLPLGSKVLEPIDPADWEAPALTIRLCSVVLVLCGVSWPGPKALHCAEYRSGGLSLT